MGGDASPRSRCRAAGARWCSPPRAAGACSRPTPAPRPASSWSPLPDDLRAAIDALVPPRWSRSNPIDLAGGETRDTIPRGARPDLRASRRRRRDPPRPRHPGDAGAGLPLRALLPGPRARAHRRVPRAPGPPLREGRARGVGAPRQAGAVRHRAGVHRSRLRQRRAGRACARRGGSATRARTAPSRRCARWSTTPSSGAGASRRKR